jgi:hypothetical protein
LIVVFFRDELLLANFFHGPAWGAVLILSEFYIVILKWLPSKKTYFRTPPARSETGIAILGEFQFRTDL